jgi:1,4-dihydroxy-2-naphthoyl-CoA hydrolase
MWKTEITLQALQERNENTLSDHLKIQFTEIGKNFLKATMPLGPHLMQPMKIMNGGASSAFAETVASAAANYCIYQKTHYCVGIELNTNHLRSVRDGVLTATAKPYHLGRSTQVWLVEIHDEKDHLISVSRLTLLVFKKKETETVEEPEK